MSAVLSLLFVPSALMSSVFALGAVNSSDYNKTLIMNLSSALNTSSERFVTSLKSKKESLDNWDKYTSIYNYDFYHERFSVAFRTTKLQDIYIASESEVKPILISDIKQSRHPRNAYNNMSGLQINFSMENFTEQSLIISEDLLNSINASIGDEVTISQKGNIIKLVIVATYSALVGDDETYLNNTYNEFDNPVCFVSNDIFNFFSKDSFNAYVTYGKNTEMLEASYREITPLLKENDAVFLIDPSLSLNDKRKDSISFSEYQTATKTKLYELNSTNNLWMYFLQVILFIVSFFLIEFSVNLSISHNYVRKHPIIFTVSHNLYAIVLGILTSVGLMNSMKYKYVDGLIVYVSFQKSLIFLSFITILYIGLFILLFSAKTKFTNDLDVSKRLSSGFLNIEKNRNHVQKPSVLNPNIDSNRGSYTMAEMDKSLIEGENINILFFGLFTSPVQSAGASRCEIFMHAYEKMGYKPYLSSLINNDYKLNHIYQSHTNIMYIPFAHTPETIVDKVRVFFYPTKKIINVLKSFDFNKPKAIFIYSVLPIDAVIYLKKYCRSNQIPLIFDVVEWYKFKLADISSVFSLVIPNRIINRFLIDNKCKVISISNYTNTYFYQKGIFSIKIPYVQSLTPTPNLSLKSSKIDKFPITIMYAGNPANRKDLLKPIFQAVAKLSLEEKCRIQILIVGVEIKQLLLEENVTEEELINTLNTIFVLGKKPKEYIEHLFSLCHYTILLRNPNDISSIAGFPTKISESLLNGVPPITNLTSDLSMYLNKDNSIILTDINSNTILKSFQNIINIDDETYLQMKLNARLTAEEKLNITYYFEDLKTIIENK